MTDNNQEIQRQIKERLDAFWSLGSRSNDDVITDGICDAFWGVADDDIHWLLERVQNLETELAKFTECTDVLCAHCHDIDREK